MVYWCCLGSHLGPIKEAERLIRDANDYKNVTFHENILQKLAGASNKLFQNLEFKGKICDKQPNYFAYEYKKATNLGKLWVLPKN